MDTRHTESFEWLKAIVIALLLGILIRQFIFALVIVDGESMLPTLSDRDRMVVNKVTVLFNTPKRFDIVVFHAPSGTDYIKRVIGLPGETIEYKNDTLYVDGKEVDEYFLEPLKKIASNEPIDAKLEPLTPLYEGNQVTEDFRIDAIPDGELFVLGDNRRKSRDSRDIGTIPIEDVIGRATVLFWPLSNMKIAK